MTLMPCSRHLDIRLLPSLVPEDGRNITAQLIEPELEARITKLRNLIDDGVLDDLSNGSSDFQLLLYYFSTAGRYVRGPTQIDMRIYGLLAIKPCKYPSATYGRLRERAAKSNWRLDCDATPAQRQ